MLNKIIIMGRLTADPEQRTTQGGTSVALLTVAVDRDYAPQGTKKETDFIKVVAWRQTADFIARYFGKGNMIIVEGRLQVRNYEDKDGIKRTIAEVVADKVYFGESKKSDGGSTATKEKASTTLTIGDIGDFEDITDDNQLPF